MTCDRPSAFLLLLLLIPAILVTIIKNKKSSFYTQNNFKIHNSFGSTLRIFHYRKFVFLRSFFLSLSWIMLVCAYAGLYWGTNLVPVQKNGTSVSFVFDISNSMLAEDGPGNTTRLKAASLYAEKLLSKIEESDSATPVSVVLAKGDGVIAIPLTQDYSMIDSLMKVMSPSLMTVPGTSLGKGVLKAKASFPSNYSSAGRIWVFTDCEETDGHLKNALVETIKAGIPVTIIGFGSETETKVLSGDGQTYIQTALRSGKVKDSIEEAQKITQEYNEQTPVKYINSTEKGSALFLLNQLKTLNGQIITYEAKPVPRYKTFLFLAAILFVLGYIFMEFDITRLNSKKSVKKASVISILLLITLLTGCSRNTSEILKGTFAFHQKEYGTAVSCYLDVVKDASKNQDTKLLDYSLYDLGTAYSKLEEDEAALEKFSQISEDAPDQIRYAAFYNCGLIANKNGDYSAAQDYFRKALAVDSSQVDAKINLELSIQQGNTKQQQTNQNQAQETPSQTEDNPESEIQDAVFERIKEKDQNKWKNSEQPQSQNSAEDY